MSVFVCDCSFAAQLVFPDERSEEAERFLTRIGADSVLWVPAIWWFEISSALLVAERRRRLSEADALHAVELIRSLPIETDFISGGDSIWRLRTIGKEHGLSAYDAAYFELAARRELPLATLDRALAQAARKAGVETL